MPYIVSTLSNDNVFADYNRGDAGAGGMGRPAVTKTSVTINGGANVANGLRTPEGVLTSVSEEELAFLQSHRNFQQQVDAGFLKVMSREADPDKVADDMTDRDQSAPLNEGKGDFEGNGRAAGVAPKKSKVK